VARRRQVKCPFASCGRPASPLISQGPPVIRLITERPGALIHPDARPAFRPAPLQLAQHARHGPPLSYVLKAWRTRYATTDGLDLDARAMLNQEEAAAVRAGVVQPDALTLWMRLADKAVHVGSPSPELIAAAALAGLAAGIRPQGFNAPDTVKP